MIENNPVMTLVVGLIVAGGALLAAFGVNVTDAQIAALSTFAVAALALGLYVRSKVTPTTKGLTIKRAPERKGERGMTEPLTLLVYVVVFVILLVVLFKVLDRL